MANETGNCLTMLVMLQALLVHITWIYARMHTRTHTHKHTCGAVNISNIFPFPLQGRQESSRSSRGLSPSLVIISFTLHTAREMNHGGWSHCVREREGALMRHGPLMCVCVCVCVGGFRGAERGQGSCSDTVSMPELQNHFKWCR